MALEAVTPVVNLASPELYNKSGRVEKGKAYIFTSPLRSCHLSYFFTLLCGIVGVDFSHSYLSFGSGLISWMNSGGEKAHIFRYWIAVGGGGN